MRDPEFVAFTTIPAKNPYGPWTVPVSGDTDWAGHDYTFYDLLLRAIPARLEKTGGTVSGVIQLLYRMPSVGLCASISEPGIKIESTAQKAGQRQPISNLLSHIGVRRQNATRDQAIWFRRLQATAANAQETDSGYTFTVPKSNLPSVILAALMGSNASCKVAFARLEQMEVAEFKMTEGQTDLRVDVLMDESVKDSVWEKAVASAGRQKTPGTPARESAGDLLQAIKQGSSSLRRLEWLKRLVVDMYEQVLAKADRNDPDARQVDMRLQSLAEHVAGVLTADSRAKIEQLSDGNPSRASIRDTRELERQSSRSSSRARAPDSRQIERLEQEIENINRQIRTSRKAFFVKTFSTGNTTMDRKILDRIAGATELAELAGTALPKPSGGTVVPAVPLPIPAFDLLPQTVTICSKTNPAEDILVVTIRKVDAK